MGIVIYTLLTVLMLGIVAIGGYYVGKGKIEVTTIPRRKDRKAFNEKYEADIKLKIKEYEDATKLMEQKTKELNELIEQGGEYIG